MSDKETNKDFEKIKFIRVFTPVHVPKYLIEQIKHRKFKVDDWYAHQESICTYFENGQAKVNPSNLLFVIPDEDLKVVGVLHCNISDVEKALIVQTFSVHKDYWSRGKAVQLLAKKCKELAKEKCLERVYWVTNYPKHSEYHGFKKSKSVLMEYDLSKDTAEEAQDG